MTHCEHFTEQGQCLLISEATKTNHFVPVSYCFNRCGPNNPDKQANMLRARGLAGKATGVIAELPSKYSMVKNLGRHALTVAKHWKQTGRVFVSLEHQADRLDVCRSCEKHKTDDKGNDRCTHESCGCHLAGEKGKTKFEALPCPIGKHSEIDSHHLGDLQHA